MRNKIGNTLWGLGFIVAGIGFAGNALNLWDFSLFFDGWWTLFIIVPCIISMVQSGVNTGNIIGVIIGGFFLLEAQDVIKNVNFYQFILPIVFLVIGFSIIFRNVFNRPIVPIRVPQAGGSNDYSAVFGGQTLNFAGQNFYGATLSAAFGGIDIDLKNAIITDDIVITATVIFGGIDIIVPPNVKVKVSSLPIFGGVENRAIQNMSESAPTIFINCTCIFGGIDIK